MDKLHNYGQKGLHRHPCAHVDIHFRGRYKLGFTSLPNQGVGEHHNLTVQE